MALLYSMYPKFGYGRDAIDRHVQVGQLLQVSGVCTHVIQFREQVAGKFPLDTEAPLLNHGIGHIRIRGAEMRGLEIQIRGVEKVGRKSVPQEEYRSRGAGSDRGSVVDQAGRVESELILAAHPLKQLCRRCRSRRGRQFCGPGCRRFQLADPSFCQFGLMSARLAKDPPVASMRLPEPAGSKLACWFLPSSA